MQKKEILVTLVTKYKHHLFSFCLFIDGCELLRHYVIIG